MLCKCELVPSIQHLFTFDLLMHTMVHQQLQQLFFLERNSLASFLCMTNRTSKDEGDALQTSFLHDRFKMRRACEALDILLLCDCFSNV
jgi:hypothetical protein